MKKNIVMKNAIILAAGFGSRLLPLTATTPKPLAIIKGKTIIESIIDSLIAKDIKEVIIVVGKFSEQFNFLIKKYNNITIKLIVNNEWDTKGNLVSLNKAINHLEDTIIIEGDNLLSPEALTNNIDQLTFTGKRCIGSCEEWVWTFNKYKKTITDLIPKQKQKLFNYEWVGITYIPNDVSKLIKEKINKELKTKKWDDAWYLTFIFELMKEKNIDHGFRTIKPSSQFEIDTYEQLVRFEPTLYAKKDK